MSDLYLRTKRTALVTQEYGGTQPFVWTEGENDLQVDANHELALVTGTEKLSQDIVKILMTDRGTHPTFPLYGAGLQSLIGQKMDLEFLNGQILSEVTDALIILQSINQFNPNLDEQIQTLQSIQVNLDSPSQIGIQLVVITKSNKAVGAIITVV